MKKTEHEFVTALEARIIREGYETTKDDALRLYECADTRELCGAADRIRRAFCGTKSGVCSIINAKTGRCGENCAYCAQSAHWKTDCGVSPMIEPERAASLCLKALDHHVSRVSLVAAGRGIDGADFETALECFRLIKKTCGGNILPCASLGIIGYDKLRALKKAGVTRYHHNLETGKNHYAKICTTHTYDDRVRTIRDAKKAGLEICCGGIIGMGETRGDRIDMAIELRDLDVQSVPVNILTPIKGTPLEHTTPLAKDEILRTFAVFRFLMPRQTLRCAAGRKTLGDNGRDAFVSGANALISGDFLTTAGSTNAEDLAMLAELGYESAV